ncbi:hypothetical protein GCM10010106_18560 [Thermopolyspora flexuosa]|uniref:Metalloprotease n=1 Tax=Thermopolyspora flexuosa TaxID=103836 RepID=A0A543J3Z4_9ACTN|nr:hypothetical protein [Thermopolyspora flexuosa]TQM77556.1 hypothetical protein FHX40_4323 [Thermopolyspora flexuosa]GGM72459.1 hypothetical protein GCM10010106_18560 [Thermopolyspora flexuosa]
MNDRRRLMMLAPPLLATFWYGSPAFAATTPAEPDPATATTTEPAADTETSGPSGLRPTGPETVPVGQEALRTMSQDERDAVQVVNRFWERNWPRNFPGRYTPPEVRGRYDPANPPMCGDVRLEPGNAYYCPSGDYITWDGDFVKGDPYLEGNTFPYIAIAHEWGHAIQHRTNELAGPTAKVELQADCLAGATLTGARNEGYLEWEPLDEERLLTAVAGIGDDLPETDPGHHGSPEDRIIAFETGEQGVQACLSRP